jgi:hypothetical protein
LERGFFMTDPVKATISGIEVVTIPATEYAELLEDRRRLRAMTEAADLRRQALDLIANEGSRRFLTPGRSRIEEDGRWRFSLRNDSGR